MPEQDRKREFLEIFREEFQEHISQEPGYPDSDIKTVMTVFDKASIQAIIKYARERNINLM